MQEQEVERLTNVLLLDEQVDSGEIVPDILRDDLRLDLVDPAVDVVTALLVEHVAVCIEELLPLGDRRVLQLLPLASQLVQLRLNLLHGNNSRRFIFVFYSELATSEQGYMKSSKKCAKLLLG